MKKLKQHRKGKFTPLVSLTRGLKYLLDNGPAKQVATLRNAFTETYLRLKILPTTIQYAVTESVVKKLAETPIANIACKSGCGACCWQNVEVTEIEAERLLPYLTDDDIEYLKKQQFKKQSDYWYGEPTSRCVFLNEDSSCRVYAERPLICYTVFSYDKELCEDTPDKIHPFPTDTKMDLAVSTYWSLNKIAPLPQMLLNLWRAKQ